MQIFQAEFLLFRKGGNIYGVRINKKGGCVVVVIVTTSYY